MSALHVLCAPPFPTRYCFVASRSPGPARAQHDDVRDRHLGNDGSRTEIGRGIARFGGECCHQETEYDGSGLGVRVCEQEVAGACECFGGFGEVK